MRLAPNVTVVNNDTEAATLAKFTQSFNCIKVQKVLLCKSINNAKKSTAQNTG